MFIDLFNGKFKYINIQIGTKLTKLIIAIGNEVFDAAK